MPLLCLCSRACVQGSDSDSDSDFEDEELIAKMRAQRIAQIETIRGSMCVSSFSPRPSLLVLLLNVVAGRCSGATIVCRLMK